MLGRPTCGASDFGGEVSKFHEGCFALYDEGAIFFGLGFQGYPLGVDFEFCPGLAGSFAALMAHDIDKGAAGSLEVGGLVGGSPEGYVVHAEALEDFGFFGAEAVEDEGLLAFVKVVDAEFVDSVVGDLGGSGSGAEDEGDHSGCSGGLDEGSAVHLGSDESCGDLEPRSQKRDLGRPV